MNTTAHDVSTIGRFSRSEAMARAATEYDRFVAAVDGLAPDAWERPTDNDLWTVKDVVAHVLGMTEMIASVPEMVRQGRAATGASTRNGTALIDELTALQVRKHQGDSVDELRRALRAAVPKALAARRRAPALLRALPIPNGSGTSPEKWKLRYLLEVVLTRDVWMHRVDVSRATGAEPVLTTDHDGRLVADVVAEWARRHGQPFSLVLTGPAGGAYTQGGAGDDLELDAVEFCRIVSGRGVATGLLTQQVPF